MKIGTWNVRGTFEEGKLKHIVNELKKGNFDAVALQETKQLGELVMEIGGYIFINSGGKDRLLGTGFLVRKELKELVVQYKLVSNRICLLRLRGKYQKITFLNIHAPHEEADLGSKEEFYNELDRLYEEIPKYDMKILLGDANAKIGREEMYKPTIGDHSKHEVTNENGKFLIDFAKEKNLIIKSTYFQRKEIYKGTWRSPDGKTINQIDHIAIEKPEVKCIKNIRTYRGLDADTDHFMVGAKLDQQIPETRNQRREKIRNRVVVRPGTREEKIEYESNLSRELSSSNNTNETTTIEEMWAGLKTKIVRAGGKYRKKVRKQEKKMV
ncbi:craniofacial development protein 2-like [Anoplophora glabripennis]|uniref:craniofacial development protein 2-like n=1 Tax=Anoplophora glabripennis TaxID=217634 RepID=UPI000C78D9D8|nr:craniofacial development protein 2-like [Anoplophora glabripennis]